MMVFFITATNVFRVSRKPHYLKCSIYGADMGQEFFKKGANMGHFKGQFRNLFRKSLFSNFAEKMGHSLNKWAVQNFISRLVIFTFYREKWGIQ